MQGKLLLSILMASVMCLQFNIQKEDMLEHTNVGPMSSIICVTYIGKHLIILVNLHFSQLVKLCVI